MNYKNLEFDECYVDKELKETTLYFIGPKAMLFDFQLDCPEAYATEFSVTFPTGRMEASESQVMISPITYDEEEDCYFDSDWTSCDLPYEHIEKFFDIYKKWKKEHRKKKFFIPVTWQVWDKVEVKADSIEEAVEWLKENIDLVPIGIEPEYVDDSYRIDDGQDGEATVEETVKYLKECWNLSGGIDGFYEE